MLDHIYQLSILAQHSDHLSFMTNECYTENLASLVLSVPVSVLDSLRWQEA